MLLHIRPVTAFSSVVDQTVKGGSSPLVIEAHCINAAKVIMLSQQLPSIGLQVIEPCLQ